MYILLSHLNVYADRLHQAEVRVSGTCRDKKAFFGGKVGTRRREDLKLGWRETGVYANTAFWRWS